MVTASSDVDEGSVSEFQFVWDVDDHVVPPDWLTHFRGYMKEVAIQ